MIQRWRDEERQLENKLLGHMCVHIKRRQISVSDRCVFICNKELFPVKLNLNDKIMIINKMLMIKNCLFPVCRSKTNSSLAKLNIEALLVKTLHFLNCLFSSCPFKEPCQQHVQGCLLVLETLTYLFLCFRRPLFPISLWLRWNLLELFEPSRLVWIHFLSKLHCLHKIMKDRLLESSST